MNENERTVTGPTDEKYIVFKREDFERYIFPHGSPPYVDYEVRDAVVIRRQDVFAPPALDAYANLIRAAIDIFVDAGGFVPGVDEEPPAIARLSKIADYFHEQAMAAWDTHRKIPD